MCRARNPIKEIAHERHQGPAAQTGNVFFLIVLSGELSVRRGCPQRQCRGRQLMDHVALHLVLHATR